MRDCRLGDFRLDDWQNIGNSLQSEIICSGASTEGGGDESEDECPGGRGAIAQPIYRWLRIRLVSEVIGED